MSQQQEGLTGGELVVGLGVAAMGVMAWRNRALIGAAVADGLRVYAERIAWERINAPDLYDARIITRLRDMSGGATAWDEATLRYWESLNLTNVEQTRIANKLYPPKVRAMLTCSRCGVQYRYGGHRCQRHTRQRALVPAVVSVPVAQPVRELLPAPVEAQSVPTAQPQTASVEVEVTAPQSKRVKSPDKATLRRIEYYDEWRLKGKKHTTALMHTLQSRCVTPRNVGNERRAIERAVKLYRNNGDWPYTEGRT